MKTKSNSNQRNANGQRSTRKREADRRSHPRRGARAGRAAARRTAADAPVMDAPGEVLPAAGVLEVGAKGFGFLRDARHDYRPDASDVFVPEKLIERFGLRIGNTIRGEARQVRAGEGARLLQVHDIDGLSPDESARRKEFDRLTPLSPHAWLRLETGREPLGTRVIDLLAPLGKGQRALIVAPPRSGKTVLLQQIGQAVAANHPDVKLMVLLIDERPEEVTDMRRHIPGEVLASSLDRDIETHVRLAQLVVERAKRLAEAGHDVLLLVDSLTRMARAFNKWVGNTGRTMSGGLDVRALDIPKKLFAGARAFEEGGSLTILATALVETGSRMDDVIFEEFKGTGNMELVLDRQLADRRVWPAIDIERSGTRREELLLDAETLRIVTLLRRTLSTLQPVEAMERLTAQLARHASNAAFLALVGGVSSGT